jgi:hypothetical protein
MMTFRSALAMALLTASLAAPMAAEEKGEPRSVSAAGAPIARTKTVETSPMKIDRLYPSMTGPYEVVAVDTSDMDWITAVRTEVVEEGGSLMGGEFFCHSQIQLTTGMRLTVNATGTDEIRLPEGFAVPVNQILAGLPAESRTVGFLGMVLNNHFPTIDRQARIRATVEYLRDEDLGSSPPPKKLYPFHLSMKVNDLALYQPPEDGPQPHEDVTTHCALVDGQETHWFVPPGKQLTRGPAGGMVPLESTIHHISAHLHNHGEYIRLTDLTDGKILWQVDVEYEKDRRQILNIPVYSSTEGFPVYPDHDYQMEVFYNNTSDADVDAMAILYMYFNPKGDRALFPGKGVGP